MIDLRSDTITKPTDEMRDAMATAEVGDDVLRDDPTVQKLEERAAQILGKEASLYVPSGTMGNQVAVHCWTDPGDEFITEEQSHIYNFEHGMFAAGSGVIPRSIKGDRGILSPDAIREAIRPDAYYLSDTSLICLESSHNRAGGTVYPLERLEDIRELANRKNLPIHLDGARIFNAATYLDVPASDIAQYADSVMFCLSKGLSAPVGSLLAGPEEFISEALEIRKMFGGGMRQAGVLAAAGLVSLNNMRDRLKEDHEHARQIAETLDSLANVEVNPESVQTNIVIFNVKNSDMNAEDLLETLKNREILAGNVGPDSIRFVLNRHVSDEDTETVCRALKSIFSN